MEMKMENNDKEYTHRFSNFKSGLIGLLVGGLAGTITMLLFAPQSGKRTRTQIEEISVQVRDQANKNIRKAVKQVRSKTNQISANVQVKVGELKQLGQDKLVAQLDRMSAALDADKTTVKNAA
jgi:gas vesicle protein